MEILLDHVGKGFFMILVVAMPVVLTAAGIGLVVGILQAVTQVQEQTIAAAPKIMGVFLTIILLGGFFSNTLSQYLLESINIAFNVVPKQGSFVLESDGYDFGVKRYQSGLERESIGDFMKNQGNLPYSRQTPASVTKTKQFPNYNPNIVEEKKVITGK